MPEYRFTYKKNGKTRNNILVEARSREDAIASFESDYPELKWYQTTSTNGTAQPA
ncbi:MAG: hypothetical protein WCD31_14535 [Gillisia sp.]